jgi:hypothetical protein
MEQPGIPKRQHIKIQNSGICPKENIQHTEHGESLKSRICSFSWCNTRFCSAYLQEQAKNFPWLFILC